MPSRVIETKNFKVIYDRLMACGPDSLILIDVDNTIITPKAAIFRTGSPYRNLLDDIKAGKYPNIDSKQIVSKWRKDRKVLLVDADWPTLIKQVCSQSIPIFAFTQMNTGPYGIIESIERWRYEELKSMNIVFAESFVGHTQITLIHPASEAIDAAVFYKGIFFTGDYSKKVVFPKILKLYSPKEVIFIDDLSEHIMGVQEVCRELNIPYTGIIFRGVDRIKGNFNKDIALAQKDSLLRFGKWLEDEAVLE